MNIYTCYTDSHNELFQMMEESLKKTNPGLNLISKKLEQECKSGDFMKEGCQTWLLGDTLFHEVNLLVLCHLIQHLC